MSLDHLQLTLNLEEHLEQLWPTKLNLITVDFKYLELQ